MGELHRKERQSGSEEGERRSSKKPLFWSSWVFYPSFFLKKEIKQSKHTENEGTESHSLASNHHLLQKLISRSAFLIAAMVGREREVGSKEKASFVLC